MEMEGLIFDCYKKLKVIEPKDLFDHLIDIFTPEAIIVLNTKIEIMTGNAKMISAESENVSTILHKAYDLYLKFSVWFRYFKRMNPFHNFCHALATMLMSGQVY